MEYGWKTPIDTFTFNTNRTGMCKRTFHDVGHLWAQTTTSEQGLVIRKIKALKVKEAMPLVYLLAYQSWSNSQHYESKFIVYRLEAFAY